MGGQAGEIPRAEKTRANKIESAERLHEVFNFRNLCSELCNN